MPITITIPTQQQLQQWQQDPGSLLAVYNAANQAKLPLGTTLPGAAAPSSNAAVSSLPGYTSTVPTATPRAITPTLVPQPAPIDLPAVPKNDPAWIAAMTEMVNNLNLQAQGAANAARIPGAMGLESQSSGNIRNALSGQLPADVINQIGQRSAERGVMTGNPYGASTSADYLKAIGLNSLQLMGTGQDWLSAALARNPSAPIFDPSGLIMTPAQEGEFALNRANLALNQQRASTDVWNMNAGREFEAASQNARNQMEVENSNAQRKLQSDLANASNQLERDRLIWQFEQNRLQREQALQLALLDQQRRGGSGGGNYGGGGGNYGGGGGGGFAPATNWSRGPEPITQPWHDPGNSSLWAGLDTVQPGMDVPYYDPANDVVQPGMNYDPLAGTGGIYPQGGAINPEGLSEEELDWLYNVGG